MPEKVLSVRIDDALIRDLKLVVVSKGITMQEAVSEMVKKYIANSKKTA